MTPYNKNDPKAIQSMFGSIAKNYDRTNAVLSLQMHRHWNNQLVKEALKSQASPATLLDLCCGTGEIAFRFLEKTGTRPNVFLLDFCEEMLACARERSKKLNFSSHQFVFLQADAQSIPLLDNSMDCVTMAYGMRNLKDPTECMKEVYRVLKPESTFLFLDLTRPRNLLLKKGHDLYLKTLLPLLGKIMTSNQKAYEYLCQSIHSFIPPGILQKMMEESGFIDLKQISLSGGIATIFSGKKPS